MVMQFKVIVEKHSDGYVAYPLGLKESLLVRAKPMKKHLIM